MVEISNDSICAMYMHKPVKIYDCTKKILIKECKTQLEADKYLGLASGSVHNIIKHKRKNKTNKLGLIITCR